MSEERSRQRGAISPIAVNACQKGNPLLKHIRNVPWEFGETVSDFQVGQRNCVLFLSLRYHKLHPNYIYERIKLLGKAFSGRFLLLHLDTKDHTKVLRELTRVSTLLDFTIVLAWSLEEAGRYIETFKAYETKSAEAIKEKVANSGVERMVAALTAIKSVNKSDAVTLMSNFETFADIANADKASLQLCPGFGPQKPHGCCVGMVIESTVIAYACWLAQQPSDPTDEDLLLILRRLGIGSLTAIKAITARKFDDVYPFFDQRKVDALIAVARFTSFSKCKKPELVLLLEWALSQNSSLNVTQFVNKRSLASEWTLTILKSQVDDSSHRVSQILDTYCVHLVKDSSDLDECSKAIGGLLDGLTEGIEFLASSSYNEVFLTCFALLQSGIFDLGEFLKDCPPGSNVEEILERHYFLLPSILSFLSSLVSTRDFAVDDALFTDIRDLLLGYFREAAQFLLQSQSEEPFLFRCCDLISQISSQHVSKEVGEFIVSILQEASSSHSMNSFVFIVESCCLLLFSCTVKEPVLLQDALKALKMVLASLSQTEGSNKVIAAAGMYIGKVLRLFIDAGAAMFCESFVSNLAFELPPDASDSENGYCTIIKALGNLSLGAKDDRITRICLSTLLAQFKKSTGKARSPVIFFEQFNLIATSDSPAYLSSVLDIYGSTYMESDNLINLKTVASGLEALIGFSSGDPIRCETILQTILRLFVDKGLAIVKAHHGKGHKKNSAPLAPPSELEVLLPALASVLSQTAGDGIIDKTARLESFQEFWFLLIFTGYQNGLSWPAGWAPYIPSIAIATPVLIKEKDRLKAVSTPLSQVLLSQSAGTQMRTDLTALMPSCTYLTKMLTLPKCLWLLSIFYTETYKLRSGILGDMMSYMTSEVVKRFELEPFVEDLLSTIIKRWLPEASHRNQSILDAFACEMLSYCCHVQERVHAFAYRFLKMVLDNHKQTYSCHALWEAFLAKMMTQYELCRRALGEETPVDGALAMNPLYARHAFENLVSLSRTMFAAASAEYPHDFYAFIQRSLQRQSGFFHSTRPGDRDIRMLELLRICVPTQMSSESYLSLPLEFQSKPEDFLQWLLSRRGGLTDKLTVSGGVDAMEAAVAAPFATGTALAFKEAVYSWASLLDAHPDCLVRFLSLVHGSWQSHVKLGVGPFGQATPVGVFAGRMDTSETTVAHLVPQSSPSIPYVLLVDFLHERLLLSLRSHNLEVVQSFYSIIASMLNDMCKLVAFSRMRAAILKVAVLAFEFLGQYEASLAPSGHCVIRAHLYGLLMQLFERSCTFSVEDRDFMRYEEGLLLKLRNYVGEEHGTLSRLAAQYYGKEGANELPNIDALAETSRLLRMLLTHEWEKMLVWHNRLPKQNYLDASSLNGYLATALKYSVPLAVQLVSQFPYITRDANLLTQFEQSSAQARIDTSETVAWWLQHGLKFDSDTRLLLAPPLAIPAAIGVFRDARISSRSSLVNYAMRSLECVRPDALYFYIPHIVQALRHDQLGYIERTIMHVAGTSSLFAHQIIWNMKANTYQDDAATIPDPCKAIFEEMCEKVTRLLAGIDRAFFEREFAFFEKVTAISGALKPYVKKEKWEKKAKIDEELKQIAVDPGVYLPSNPESIVVDIDYESGRPLQSHAKAPFMATFRVRPADDPSAQPIWQSVIFKVGDDCRQDVLALQFITALKNIFASVNLNLYFFPYRVVATAPGCGVIEVIPNSISRDQLGREKINSLYEYFRFKFGDELSEKFAQARENFVKSMAAYSIACYILAIKDRHNGNIMISDAGHIIHIDFGFILDLSPGGISVESSFKLTTEMLAVMGGRDDSAPYFAWYRELCCQGFLVMRKRAEDLIRLVEVMVESGLPCFAKSEAAMRRLRGRFRLDLSEADARQFFYDLVYKSCESFRTGLYDKYQEKTNGIPY